MQEINNRDELIRTALQGTTNDIIVAHIDNEQRYTFIYNLHPDFSMEGSLGKRDDEIALNDSNIKLRELKRSVLKSGVSQHKIISFNLKRGKYIFKISVAPLYDDSGNIKGATCVYIDITDIINSKFNNEIISICTFCKSIKENNGQWDKVEAYLYNHNKIDVSHGICPECMESHYPEVYKKYNHLIAEFSPEKDK